MCGIAGRILSAPDKVGRDLVIPGATSSKFSAKVAQALNQDPLNDAMEIFIVFSRDHSAALNILTQLIKS